MPIYEYRCADCKKLTSVFTRSMQVDAQPACQHCGSANTSRIISRVAYHKTEQQILEEYGVPGDRPRPEDYKDPRQIGRWVEKKFQEYGMELPRPAREMIDAAREGEFPEPVKDL
ncbi:MAG TPA: zinc ribbon domain-containing protein [Dehalococcoidia bacterium]|jgi:putative FmdB family regulatory protein|nr:zinc ribbon domain-containing protein [Dehalococcoidia bacterium]